ncbi:hypothetical protein PEC311524_06420 [Pectobacterium carotovorum subsp. carotovorum]|nr:hypothetical protein PEC311524_06420 [Pectobacterium carotovorum subsp. carotovorum]
MRHCIKIIITSFLLSIAMQSISYANDRTHYTILDEIKSPSAKNNAIHNLLMNGKSASENIKQVAASPYCIDRYVNCMQGEGHVPGRVYGTSQCADCLRFCDVNKYWPPACI